MSKFKILIIAIVLIIVGAIVYNYSQLQDEQIDPSSNTIIKITEPKIEVSPKSYNLGDVVYGDVAEHTFIVKNIGGKPLEILRLSTSCGCTTAEIADENKIIKQGESVDMIVAFDPAVMDDSTLTGPVERVVYIKTNDPDQPEVEVDLNANVIRAENLTVE